MKILVSTALLLGSMFISTALYASTDSTTPLKIEQQIAEKQKELSGYKEIYSEASASGELDRVDSYRAKIDKSSRELEVLLKEVQDSK